MSTLVDYVYFNHKLLSQNKILEICICIFLVIPSMKSELEKYFMLD